MRAFPVIFVQAAVVLTLHGSPCRAAEATSTVSVHVPVASRTSLKVSSQIVEFSVLQADGDARASVDFSAGARVASGADVVLTVEPLRQLEGPGGAADVEASIVFDGDGDGLVRGRLDNGPAVAGRWQGSGLRQGRVWFTIRANAAGTYTVPLRFVLSTP
jgi:hypothetical protein